MNTDMHMYGKQKIYAGMVWWKGKFPSANPGWVSEWQDGWLNVYKIFSQRLSNKYLLWIYFSFVCIFSIFLITWISQTVKKMEKWKKNKEKLREQKNSLSFTLHFSILNWWYFSSNWDYVFISILCVLLLYFFEGKFQLDFIDFQHTHIMYIYMYMIYPIHTRLHIIDHIIM